MKKYFKSGLPLTPSGNTAAIIHSDITLRFLCKEQFELFLKEYVKIQERPSLSVETEGENPNVYVITINDIPWGHSLSEIALLVEKYDYSC